MQKTFSDLIQSATGINNAVLSRIFSSLTIIIILWLLRTIIIRVIWRRTDEPLVRYRWQKGTIYGAAITGFILIGRVWFAGIQTLATYLGLLSAGLAIALQDLVKSFAGWIFIISRRPFVVGDRIQIGPHAGDVIDIRIFKFSLIEIGNWVDADQSTGRIIHVPNSLVLTDVIANYTREFEFIWNEIAVLVTFESNWEKAKNILREIAERHATHLSQEAERRIKEASKRFMIFYKTLTPTVYTSVRDCGVLLTIRYLIDPRKRRTSSQAIWEDILRSFKDSADIDLAYPTQRFYNNVTEGKPEARAPVMP